MAIHILKWGAILSVVLLAIALISWIVDPKIYGSELGVDEIYQNRKGGLITGILILLAAIILIIFALKGYEKIDPELGFGTALFIGYLIFQIFNLADLFILDWLIYMKIKPAFMYPEYLPPISDFSYHLKASMRGLIWGVIPTLISTLIWKFLL
ncbi:MAG: hypothetical protein AAGD28_06390 [Bacteroidota bacterium]